MIFLCIKARENLFNDELNESGEPYFVRANYSNNRIIRQSGGFIVPQSKCLSNSLKISSEEKTTFLVKREKKSKILEELKAFNIHDATMFAEMDKVASFICANFNDQKSN